MGRPRTKYLDVVVPENLNKKERRAFMNNNLYNKNRPKKMKAGVKAEAKHPSDGAPVTVANGSGGDAVPLSVANGSGDGDAVPVREAPEPVERVVCDQSHIHYLTNELYKMGNVNKDLLYKNQVLRNQITSLEQDIKNLQIKLKNKDVSLKLMNLNGSYYPSKKR